jgi:hypothetical protein
VERAARRWRDERVAEYQRVLQLTPEQAVTLERHFDRLTEEFKGLRGETRAKIAGTVADMNKAIAQDLTPEQRRLFWDHLREKARKAND